MLPKEKGLPEPFSWVVVEYVTDCHIGGVLSVCDYDTMNRLIALFMVFLRKKEIIKTGG